VRLRPARAVWLPRGALPAGRSSVALSVRAGRRAGGVPPDTQWTRDAGGQIYILHVHGPSLDKVVCVLEFVDLEGRGLGRPWPPEQKRRIVNVCAPSGGSVAHHQMDMVLAILETAYMNDKGRLYRATDDTYRTLLLLQR